MTLCYNAETKLLVEIPESQLNSWAAAGNPKASVYLPTPPKPSEDAVWSEGTWFVPSPAVPESITARQIRMWLVLNGHDLAQITAAIDAIEDPVQREVARVDWNWAPYVDRTHPMVASIAAGLGLTAEEVDGAFVEANLL